MRDLVDEFKRGLIGIKLFNATAEELREIENLVKLKWASGHHLEEKMEYTATHEVMYVSAADKCIYQTWSFLNKRFVTIMAPADFIDGCKKQTASITEEEMMELFTSWE